VIDNPQFISDLGFGLSTQIFHFNQNPKKSGFFINKVDFQYVYKIVLRRGPTTKSRFLTKFLTII